MSRGLERIKKEYQKGDMLKKVHKNISTLILANLLIFISCNNGNNYKYLPQQLGGLSLAKVIQNKNATVIINKMHGKKLDDSENFIAFYGSNQSKNILYVSVYENAEKAERNIKNMAMKMANGSSVFSPLTHSKIGDSVHFEIEGMGLKHYFYRIDNILIWWQVEPDKAVAAYNDLLKFDFAVLKDRVKVVKEQAAFSSPDNQYFLEKRMKNVGEKMTYVMIYVM
jgi:hypothetical protein